MGVSMLTIFRTVSMYASEIPVRKYAHCWNSEAVKRYRDSNMVQIIISVLSMTVTSINDLLSTGQCGDSKLCTLCMIYMHCIQRMR